ncbi:MAG TPA: D-alanine--D-serine ligase VanG [Petrotogaceae bacterium]|nr:D-alanine--D-serine ligase VanG [Petrotogaceae bacterium]HQF33105.1 D-alanine--D-serine ligase VanG [Petrotogaceae bacterium]HQH33284.1 D-alanine--D-serine ligase VanG [Petrotogaceae bacterium]HQI77967.1 D-alanine--D-serine ligase VanG [Petrotogaceae bacterium]
MERLSIAVIFGGCSPEYNISLKSAHAVISAMDKRRYQPVILGVSSKGDWFKFDGDLDKILNDTWCNSIDCTPAVFSSYRSEKAVWAFNKDKIEKFKIDAAFPIMHGKNGEDGTVQGLLELLGIPLIGCGTLCSALCMDKYRAHMLVKAAGINVPTSFLFDKATDIERIFEYAEKIHYPLYIKPLRAGSSYGITKVWFPGELPDAVGKAFEYDDQAVAEENIQGYEVGCAVMGNGKIVIGQVDEIRVPEGFFSYEHKYMPKASLIKVPADISHEKAQEIKETAQNIYRLLGCRGFARVDMFVDMNEKVVFNEVNTIPGFTSGSRFPNMFKACGMTFEELISDIIGLGLET